VPSIVVIGSGLAGYGVLRELRKLAPDADLTLITADDGHFYSKPALSTAFTKGKTVETLITMPAEKMASQLRLNLKARCRVHTIDCAARTLDTDYGVIAYDQLVLALGADPIRPSIGGDAANRAMAINSLDDYAAFIQTVPAGGRVLIIGAGLVGSEFANDLASNGFSPVVIDRLPYPLAQLLPAPVGRAVQDALASIGVAWRLGRLVERLDHDAAGIVATLDDDTTISGDAILSAVGLRPHVSLAERAGLVVGRGIKVNACGQTSDEHIFAIGDCAEYEVGPAAFVTPIMAAARAIAPSVLGTITPIRFPALSVQVKTSACPLVLLPVRPGVAGDWIMQAQDERGLKYLFVDSHGTVQGYALTGDFCAERVELDREIIAGSLAEPAS
jgi:rubredoxin-NAD+ reductase